MRDSQILSTPYQKIPICPDCFVPIISEMHTKCRINSRLEQKFCTFKQENDKKRERVLYNLYLDCVKELEKDGVKV